MRVLSVEQRERKRAWNRATYHRTKDKNREKWRAKDRARYHAQTEEQRQQKLAQNRARYRALPDEQREALLAKYRVRYVPKLDGPGRGNKRKRRLLDVSDAVYRRDTYLRRAYGITFRDQEAIFETQKRCCAICRISTLSKPTHRWHLDHNHTTGAIRRILCQPCNQMLGFARENIGILQAAIEYLEKFL